jgi:D-3-phosphoglycerate dehydrogenase
MKILISSRSFGKINTEALDLLRAQGLEPVLNPYGRKMKETEIIDLLDGVIGIIAGTEEITETILNAAPQLKVISRYGVGLDNIDIKAAERHNILVYNTPETPAIAVAELTLTFMLSLLKKIGHMDRNLRNDTWKTDIGYLLTGKTIGIIGLGRIGKQVVRLLTPFSVHIIAYDEKPDKTFAKKHHIQLAPFTAVLEQSDVITLHIPITPSTRNLISAQELKSMKPHAVLINTARGGLIDEHALYTALYNKTIAGAALDVFADEPHIGKLKELDTIIVTPHIGTATFETRKHMELEAAGNIITGLKQLHIVP